VLNKTENVTETKQNVAESGAVHSNEVQISQTEVKKEHPVTVNDLKTTLDTTDHSRVVTETKEDKKVEEIKTVKEVIIETKETETKKQKEEESKPKEKIVEPITQENQKHESQQEIAKNIEKKESHKEIVQPVIEKKESHKEVVEPKQITSVVITENKTVEGTKVNTEKKEAVQTPTTVNQEHVNPKPIENTNTQRVENQQFMETPQPSEIPQKEADSPKKDYLPQQQPQTENGKDSIAKDEATKPSKPETSEEKAPEKPVHSHTKKDDQVLQTPVSLSKTAVETPDTKVVSTPYPHKQSDDIVKRIDINNADKDLNLSQKIKENDVKSQNDTTKNGKKRDGTCTKCIII